MTVLREPAYQKRQSITLLHIRTRQAASGDRATRSFFVRNHFIVSNLVLEAII